MGMSPIAAVLAALITPKDPPPEPRKAYGRMSFEADPPWLLLSDTKRKREAGVVAVISNGTAS